MTKIKPLFFSFLNRKARSKIIVSLIIIMFLLSFISVFSSNVKATSAETTGLILVNTNTNQGRYISIGGFDIFATDNKILFYDPNDGSLVKTWILPDAGVGHYEKTAIGEYNTTCIIIGFSILKQIATNYYSVMEYYLLNINTLVYNSYVAYTSASLGGVWYVGDMGQVLVKTNNIWYSVFTHATANGVLSTYVVRLTNTSLLLYSTTANMFLRNSTIYIQSLTNANSIYILTASGNSRFEIYLVDLVTPTITDIGQSGIDYTWGSYVYFFGSIYTTDGVNSWYNIGIVYNNLVVNKDIYPMVIQFNNTFIAGATGYRVTFSESSAVNLLRCLSVSYDGIWDRATLMDGDYEFYFIGSAYGAMMQPFQVGNLTDTITTNHKIDNVGAGLSIFASVFGDNGVQWHHYYTSSNSIGGFLAPTGLMIQYDYQNNKAVVNKWASLNPVFGYIFSLSPMPLQIVSSGTILRAVCKQQSYYIYYGELFNNGLRTSNGTFTVQSTGLSTNYNIPTIGIYGNILYSGNIAMGLLSFQFNTRQSSYVTIYEGIKVSITIGGFTTSFIHLFVWTTDNSEDGLPKPTGYPQPTSSVIPPNPIIPPWINPDWIFYMIVGFYIGSIVGMCVAFYYMQNSNVPFAVGLGLVVATILCNLLNILGTYTYPIDAIVVVVMIVIIIFMSGHRTNSSGSNPS